ncbi:GntR family transcriptional regulator [Jiella marina]|uniref:GntR family transcriptional regulator n=1 Tax=Jiella sp. LLJ827 TaxID=2917712 RepID=UPI00210094CF|nr:GntR family transcriptional regulator [Jiella sp. LLJ827]MCQ0989305.1 GntR family transcriptional regulator [Jiella sp. LLJ827]
MSRDNKQDAPRGVLSEVIAEHLEKEIVEGLLSSGAKLDETAIAKRFEVSRTPVREAFMLLVSRALAERIPYRGVVVCDLSIERIEQMFEAMGEIEGLCGRLAAGRMSASERADLLDRHKAMQRLAAAGDFQTYERLNTELHDQIYAGTHNADLIEIAHQMRLKLAPFRRSQLLNMERVEQSNAEHEEIVQGIIERDAVTAERRLRLHLISSAQTYITALKARVVEQASKRGTDQGILAANDARAASARAKGLR